MSSKVNISNHVLIQLAERKQRKFLAELNNSGHVLRSIKRYCSRPQCNCMHVHEISDILLVRLGKKVICRLSFVICRLSFVRWIKSKKGNQRSGNSQSLIGLEPIFHVLWSLKETVIS